MLKQCWFLQLRVPKTSYYVPDCRKGCNKHCFCPSLCPLRTQRIIWEPKGLVYPNFEWRFPNLDATSTPVSRSNGQRWGLQMAGVCRVGQNRRPQCLSKIHYCAVCSHNKSIELAKQDHTVHRASLFWPFFCKVRIVKINISRNFIITKRIIVILCCFLLLKKQQISCFKTSNFILFYKNLAIAIRLHVSCTQKVTEVTQDHWKCHDLMQHIYFPITVL